MLLLLKYNNNRTSVDRDRCIYLRTYGIIIPYNPFVRWQPRTADVYIDGLSSQRSSDPYLRSSVAGGTYYYYLLVLLFITIIYYMLVICPQDDLKALHFIVVGRVNLYSVIHRVWWPTRCLFIFKLNVTYASIIY